MPFPGSLTEWRNGSLTEGTVHPKNIIYVAPNLYDFQNT